MNAESSRSHLVLSILLEVKNKTTGAVNRGKLSLIDLAGSERAAKTGASQQQLKEANSINKSLSALGDVIAALSSEAAFVPYRNNKLTELMQDRVGNNENIYAWEAYRRMQWFLVMPPSKDSPQIMTNLKVNICKKICK